MANEITNANSGDIRAAHILNRQVHYKLADMVDLRGLCTEYIYGPGGSLVRKIPILGTEYTMGAVSEAAAVANTALDDGSFTLSPARRSLRFETTDLWALGADGAVDDETLVNIIAMAAGRTFTGMLTALFPSLSTAVGGGAGVDFSVDDAFSAMFALNVAKSSGRQAFVLSNHSFNEFISSLRGESGPLQFLAANAEMMSGKGSGYKGEWLGREVWTTDQIVEGSGVANNALLDEGAFARLEAPVGRMLPMIDRRIAFADSSVFVTNAYDDETATWRKIGNYYPAVAEQEDARGVLITSDDV